MQRRTLFKGLLGTVGALSASRARFEPQPAPDVIAYNCDDERAAENIAALSVAQMPVSHPYWIKNDIYTVDPHYADQSFMMSHDGYYTLYGTVRVSGPVINFTPVAAPPRGACYEFVASKDWSDPATATPVADIRRFKEELSRG